MLRFLRRVFHLLRVIKYQILSSLSFVLIEGWYGGFWNFRQNRLTRGGVIAAVLYACYLQRYAAYIGEKTFFAAPPILPHGLNGIHISNAARIGKNVVIFQQVTIGSKTTEKSKNQGAPVIGDNVFIGAGAKIIGKVTIGDNSRIGANCVVVKDLPANSTAVLQPAKTIVHTDKQTNTFRGIADFLETNDTIS